MGKVQPTRRVGRGSVVALLLLVLAVAAAVVAGRAGATQQGSSIEVRKLLKLAGSDSYSFTLKIGDSTKAITGTGPASGVVGSLSTALARGTYATGETGAGSAYASHVFCDDDSWTGDSADEGDGETSVMVDLDRDEYVRCTVTNVRKPVLANPDLGKRCGGLRILLVLDESGSVAPARNTVRGAVDAFLGALAGTGSEVGMVKFSTAASGAAVPYTAVDDGSIAGAFDSFLDGYSPDGWTNWEDGLARARAFAPADLVVLFTDGNPNTWLAPGGTLTDEETEGKNVATQAAAIQAKALMDAGSHVFVVGVDGSESTAIDIDRIKAVSGPTEWDGRPETFAAADFVRVTGFTGLGAALEEIVGALCASSVTVTKRLDGSPAGGWTFTADVSTTAGRPGGSDERFSWLDPAGGEVVSPSSASKTTGADGRAYFQWKPKVAAGATSLVRLTEADRPGYVYAGATCTVARWSGGTETKRFDAKQPVVSFSLGSKDSADCVVDNRTRRGSLTVEKRVDWNGAAPNGQRTFQICIKGPSYPNGSEAGACRVFDFDGGSETWDDLLVGDYTVTEADPGALWSVAGSGAVVAVDDRKPAAAVLENAFRAGRLDVLKTVDWNGATPDRQRSFELCVTGPSFPQGDCKSVGFDGGLVTWPGLVPGDYAVSETDPGAAWSVVGTGAVSVAAGATAVRTVSNSHRRGSLRVAKSVVGGSGTFTICVQGPSFPNGNEQGACKQTSGGTLLWESLLPGAYAVSEDAGPLWSMQVAGSPATVPAGGIADASVTNTRKPSSISVTKTADPASVSEAGGLVTYTVSVENTSPADDIAIEHIRDSAFGDVADQSDPALTDTTCDDLVGRVLAPGGDAECTFSVFLRLDVDDEANPHVNVVTVDGRDESGRTREASDEASVRILDVPSSIVVTKTATPTGVTEPGGDVQYTVVVRNTSATDSVRIASLADDRFGDVAAECGLPFTLAPGHSATCTFIRHVAGAGGDRPTNVVTASGTDDDGHPVSGSDDATVTIATRPSSPPPPPPPAPRIDVAVTKTDTPDPVKVNGELTYVLTVLNNGPATATGVEVADPAPGGIAYLAASTSQGSCVVVPALVTCAMGSLPPGASAVVTVRARASQAGLVTNTATAIGKGGQDTDETNNTASATTLVVAPALPPRAKPQAKPKPKPPVRTPAICASVRVDQKLLRATGAPQRIRVKVSAAGKPVRGARVLVRGPGIARSVVTKRNGLAVIAVKPARPGIVTVSIRGKRGCNTQRIGIVGVFEPPVTG